MTGGDCAESFDEFNINKIKDYYKIMLQIGMILTYATGLPTIKIGRIAGQFAKPRSEEFELFDNKKILTYRGDIINDYDVNKREPDPNRMIHAYHQSVQTLNLLRAFSSGGYADVNKVHSWNLDFISKSNNDEYTDFANKVTTSLNFVKGLGIDINSKTFTQTNIFTGHECLLLPYEEGLTRSDSRTQNYYDCSSHFLWLGERTRNLDSAHVEFMRGISNPLGIKISHKVNPKELIELINILNPTNLPGKIILITRMGAENIKNYLPCLIKEVKDNNLYVTWSCDPMHSNTITTKNNIKTRYFDSIKQEIIEYFNVHKKMSTFPGGIHLELTSNNVTECIGGNIKTISENDLNLSYESKCDPRLNYDQSLEIAFLISNLLK